MRELEVIGLAPDGKHLVCTDKATGEKFRLPADDKLRAASRGDIARFGQIEIEMESTLRPKDIQSRIRAGATIEQVAAESGMPASKVERYAYPVLLERSRAAQLAQLGHPLRDNGPAVLTLADVVALAFRSRGHDLDIAEWDAWKGSDGHWVAQLRWQAGRTANAAHWRFTRDAHGGTVVALDDAATDLVDPDFGRPLRGLAKVTPMSAAAHRSEDSQHTLDEYFETAPTSNRDTHKQAEEVETVEVDDEPAARSTPAPASNKNKRGKPAMPSWEDVLLGVRSSGH
ncbi:septation protein SepH [Antrihabitans sp. YC2-6]|uniref:septation protein SepH n=1 Tax=Antrihabitans sp. YC2-6 TaxID=2799498 RepID=UPI0018F3F83C|nr:septation protein SepH [Antrihabitans sp. YC2-6]MBJ8344200.1 DUF3071 domain-containing protein [Antrihabitans sp. YC2-6]